MEIRVHNKKISTLHFDDVVAGIKKAELRINDCDYRKDDLLALHEWTPKDGYSGRVVYRTISHVLTGGQYGLAVGSVVLSLGLMPQSWGVGLFMKDPAIIFKDVSPLAA